MNAAAAFPAAVSFDIEDWFHPELVRSRVAADDVRSVVSAGTEAILELLARRRVAATFFVLGDIAKRKPELVQRIAAAGHEIACHGMTHRPLWQLDRDSFRAELRDFRAAIRAALGHDPVVGFRAPTFSLDHTTAWAIDVLSEEGFRWDSSIFPLRVGLYGVPNAPLGIYRIAADLVREAPAGALLEFPVAVGTLGSLRLPVAGGFYLRALPLAMLTATLDRIARTRPFVLYLHPWECAPGLPRVRLSPRDAFITYCNLGSVMRKLDALLSRYAFTTMSGILERHAPLAPAA
jgi:peptidoglycan-N-acetylglucosamine deacetylase